MVGVRRVCGAVWPIFLLLVPLGVTGAVEQGAALGWMALAFGSVLVGGWMARKVGALL